MATDVRVIWSKRRVELVSAGPECSVIRWRDTKVEQTFPNDQIVRTTERKDGGVVSKGEKIAAQ
jgi:hypothetical protein